MRCTFLKFSTIFLIFCYLILSTSPKLWSTEIDTTLAKFYFEKGEKFVTFSNYDSASYYFIKAGDIFEAASLSNWSLRTKTNIVLCYTRNYLIREAYQLAIENLTKWEDHPEVDTIQLARNWSFRGLNHCYVHNDIEAALAMIQRAEDMVKTKLETTALENWIFYYHRSIVYYYAQNMDKVLTNTEQSLNLLENDPNDHFQSRVEVELVRGSAFRLQGNYEQSIQSYHHALQQLQLIKAKYTLGQSMLAQTGLCLNLGNAYYDNQEIEKSLRYLSQGLALEQEFNGERRLPVLFAFYLSIANAYKSKEDKEQALSLYQKIITSPEVDQLQVHRGIAYGNSGTIYLALGKHDLALENFQAGLEVFKKVYGEENLSVADATMNIGDVWYESGDYTLALDYFKRAQAIRKKNLGPESFKTLETMPLISKAYRKLGEHQKAITTSEQALRYCLVNPPDSIDWTQDFAMDKFQSLLTAQQVSFSLSRAYYESYQQTELEEERIKSYQAAQWSINIIDSLRKHALLEIEDQYNYNSKVHGSFENALLSAVAMYEATREEVYLDKLLEFMEKSKSNALLNSMERNRHVKYAKVPKSLRQQARQWQTELNQSKEKWTQARLANDSTQINQSAKVIFAQTARYDSLVLQIEQNYPDYYQIKYGATTILDHSRIAQFLEPDQAIVEYFIGEENIIVLVLDQEQIHFVQLNLPEDFDRDVEQLLAAIYDCHVLKYSGQQVTDSLWEKRANEYSILGHKLYQLLVEPIKKQLAEKKSLIIIPDGVLGNVPFEALLETPVKEVGNYNQYDYLLNKYAISYAYSATLLDKAKQKKLNPKIKKQLLAFAPKFSNCPTEQIAFQDAQKLRSNYFGPIQNENEVASICSIVPGRSFTQQQASLSNFHQLVPQYAFIHIASHAKANDQYPDFSLIGFTDTLNNNCSFDSLTAAQIYNIPLDAELVTLSACEGGAGKQQKGTGIRSLAMAFTYAGAKSLCATLWSVQDQAMTDLMTNFYQSLSEGKPKNQALTIAKRQYIEQHDNRLAHPFYWAAPIIIGDISATQFDSYSYWPFALALALLLLVIGGIYLKSRK